MCLLQVKMHLRASIRIGLGWMKVLWWWWWGNLLKLWDQKVIDFLADNLHKKILQDIPTWWMFIKLIRWGSMTCERKYCKLMHCIQNCNWHGKIFFKFIANFLSTHVFSIKMTRRRRVVVERANKEF